MRLFEEKTFRIKQHDEVVADIPVDILADDAPVYHLPSKEASYYQEFQAMENEVPAVDDHQAMLRQLLQQPDHCKQGMGIQAI